MKIAVFGSRHHAVAVLLIEQMIKHFKNKRDFSFIMDKNLFDFLRCKNFDLQNITTIENSASYSGVGLVLSFGGDGTFLKTASCISRNQIPILGINAGRLGFLTDLSGRNISDLFMMIENSEFETDERTLIEVASSDNIDLEFPFALNEVAVMKQDTSSMINIEAKVNGDLINTYRADGLIIATPTGSTAYSMSVGGPIVVPQAANFILSPIASHSLNVRPLIIPDSWEIELAISSRSNSYLIALDGRSRVLKNENRLVIRRAPHKILIAKQKGRNFFDTLQEKLMWGADARN
ncbi:MAG: NAD kinase [Prevotellaceae bacterium]|jgi:NAD+ kinase|nr:NAD kinase [Prevotellaceae bacterium]